MATMYRLEAPGHSVQGALRVVTWPSVCLPLAPVPWNSLNHFNFSYWKLTLSNNTLVCGKDPNKLIFRSKLCASCLQFWNLFLFLPLLLSPFFLAIWQKLIFLVPTISTKYMLHCWRAIRFFCKKNPFLKIHSYEFTFLYPGKHIVLLLRLFLYHSCWSKSNRPFEGTDNDVFIEYDHC